MHNSCVSIGNKDLTSDGWPRGNVGSHLEMEVLWTDISGYVGSSLEMVVCQEPFFKCRLKARVLGVRDFSDVYSPKTLKTNQHRPPELNTFCVASHRSFPGGIWNGLPSLKLTNIAAPPQKKMGLKWPHFGNDHLPTNHVQSVMFVSFREGHPYCTWLDSGGYFWAEPTHPSYLKKWLGWLTLDRHVPAFGF